MVVFHGQCAGRAGTSLWLSVHHLSPRAHARCHHNHKFSTRQIYFAHFALTDTAADKHVAFERFSRGASNLAGASSELRKVFIEDWTIEIADDTASAFRLVAREGDYQINLDVKSTKPPALQGDRGLSQKGSTVGNASYYYSLTRMQTTGEIKTPSGVYRVQGSSWMDREWSTSVLEANVVGWDWFALQLDDQRDIMLFQLRDASGARFSSIKGAMIDASGNVQVFKADDVTLDVIDHWTSPSGVRYPSKWQLRLPRLNLDLEIAPRIKDQEMKNISTQYWEGAVSIAGKATNNAINGVGYVELTGYAAPMNGRL